MGNAYCGYELELPSTSKPMTFAFTRTALAAVIVDS